MLSLLGIIVLALIICCLLGSLLGKLMNKSKKATQAMLIFNMNKYGPDSLSTIATVTSLVKQMFKDEGIKKTVAWYLDNKQWWEDIINGEYKNYYEKMYGDK